MTNSERIMDLIRQRPGLTDRQIRETTGIEPHQQVNQIARRLEAKGLVRRERGSAGHIINLPAGARQPSLRTATRRSTRTPKVPRGDHGDQEAIRFRPKSTLIVIPCSQAKATGGKRAWRSRGAQPRLATESQRLLEASRSRLRSVAILDDTKLLPAYRRYRGGLYLAAGDSFKRAESKNLNIAILSGGYGLVWYDDPIGWYERAFRASDWPDGQVSNALVELAAQQQAQTVIGIFGASTQYARAFRKAPWPKGQSVRLLSPVPTGGGAQRTVPHASGELLRKAVRGSIPAGWKSRQGLALNVEVLR